MRRHHSHMQELGKTDSGVSKKGGMGQMDMTNEAFSLPPLERVTVRAGISSLAVLLLTVIHHAYGALIYDAAFRSHIALFAIPLAVLITSLLYLSQKLRNRNSVRITIGLAALLIVLFLVLLLGIYEGGYNHIVKNVLHFSGASRELMQKLFPVGLYEMPNDALFEITGVLQLPVALLAGWDAIRLARLAGNA
jgi:hypothetical protein